MLLGHSSQPIPGQPHVRMKPPVVYKEIYDYVQSVNADRSTAKRLLMREFENGISMKKKCLELIAINEQRIKDVLGAMQDFVYVESEDEKGDSDEETTSALSMSEANDDIFSHFSQSKSVVN